MIDKNCLLGHQLFLEKAVACMTDYYLLDMRSGTCRYSTLHCRDCRPIEILWQRQIDRRGFSSSISGQLINPFQDFSPATGCIIVFESLVPLRSMPEWSWTISYFWDFRTVVWTSEYKSELNNDSRIQRKAVERIRVKDQIREYEPKRGNSMQQIIFDDFSPSGAAHAPMYVLGWFRNKLGQFFLLFLFYFFIATLGVVIIRPYVCSIPMSCMELLRIRRMRGCLLVCWFVG